MKRPLKLIVLPAIAVVLLVGCGSEDTDPSNDAPDAGLPAVKSYLTDHAADLATEAAKLKVAADAYHGLARSAKFEYARLLKRECRAVDAVLTDARNAFVKANPAYEEMEAIVAGIPRMAQYDTDIDAGSDAEDPARAVSFNLKLNDGRVMKQPGNLFFLLETSLYGTNDELVAKGVRPDVDCDGRIRFGEGLPDAAVFKAAADELDRQARDLEADAREIVITDSDAFTAITVMLPTLAERFEQWKLSSFVAGEGRQEEQRFVAASRLADIADVLTGIAFTYDEVRPLIAERDEDRAERIREELEDLLARAEDLRDREAAGERFDAAQADRFGAEMQAQAERIAGQVSQAAHDLGVDIQEP